MFDQPVMQRFIALAHKRSFAPNQTLMHAGDPPQSVYLILEGSVSVRLDDVGGRQLVLAYLQPGQFIGEMCLFPELAARSAIVRTRKPTLVCEMGMTPFLQFARDEPEIMFVIAGQLAARLHETNQRVANLSFLDVGGRLARVLVDLAKKPDAVDHPDGRTVRISRQELARHVGCSREMAGRVLKRLETDGMVISTGRTILVRGATVDLASTS